MAHATRKWSGKVKTVSTRISSAVLPLTLSGCCHRTRVNLCALVRLRGAAIACGRWNLDGSKTRWTFPHILVCRKRGKHGARSPQQAIAIGLSKARRAGVPLRPPKKGKAKESTRTSARRTHKKGQRGEDRKPSPRASRARKNVLKRESHRSASRGALASQTRRAARGPTSASKRAAAKKAVATKGKAGRQAAARKAARTPARRG
jgi:hypothetical protein